MDVDSVLKNRQGQVVALDSRLAGAVLYTGQQTCPSAPPACHPDQRALGNAPPD